VEAEALQYLNDARVFVGGRNHDTVDDSSTAQLRH
jgi:hypothetical protein